MNFFLVPILLFSSALACCQSKPPIQTQAKKSHTAACVAARDPGKHIDGIIKTPREYIKNSSDGCVFSLIDSLANHISEPLYIEALNQLASEGDGDVSEYFLDIGLRLFYKNFLEISTYLYNHKGEENALEKVIIEALSMEISDADDSQGKRKTIRTFITTMSEQKGLDQEIENYMLEMERRLTPDLFD